MEEIYFKEQARERITSGINKLRDAVASTMGPNGKTVIFSDPYGNPLVTKDGATVAANVQLKDPVENMGASLIKEVAKKTADDAGDGTTTATVLAAAFINNLKEFESSEINKAFDEIIPKIITQLKLNSKELKREEIKYVASISANNDIQIGDIIQQAYNHSDIVKVEEGSSDKDILELVNGMKLDVSYFSKHFVTNESKGVCELINPYVLIIDGKLNDLQVFEEPIQEIASANDSLLIITESVSEKALRLLESNVLSGNLNACVIKTPGFGQYRKDLIRDLSDFTGAVVIKTETKNNYKSNVLGKLKSCKIGKNESILVKDESVDIEDIIKSLKEFSQTIGLSVQDKELIKNRYENLSGSVSIIKVGGGSEVEMKERKDRYDDAVLAVACALEEGIVEGGGKALNRAGMSITEKNEVALAIVCSLYEPSYTICKNGYECNYVESMFEQNIIDPLKVTRCALENAVSIAKVVLSTDTVILNQNQWN